MAGNCKTHTPEFREEAVRTAVKTSRPVSEVGRESEMNVSILGNWVRDYQKKHSGKRPPLELSERARRRELERENHEPRMKAEFPPKAAAHFAAEER